MAYLTINSTFTPYSFDELIKPFAMYDTAYREQEAYLDAARENDPSVTFREGSIASNMYNSANESLNAVSDELAVNGLSPELKSRIRKTARDYNSTMKVLNTANERLQAERDRRVKLGSDYVFQQQDLNIDDFLNGNTPNQRGESLSDITKDIAAQFTSRAQQISRDTWDKVFAGNGRVVGGYFDITSESGLTSAQLDSIMSSDEEWNAMMANPTIPSSQKELLQGFRNAIISKKEAIGYDSYDTDSKRRIDSAIFTGAHGALGATTHKYQADKNFESPELRYRKERDKVEDAEKERQQRIDKGEEAYFIDDAGNQYFKRGSVYWVKDKDGKTITPPTTAGGMNKAETEAKSKTIPTSIRDKYPKYFSASGKDNAVIKWGHEGRYNVNQGTKVDFSVLSEGKQVKIKDKLAKDGLSLSDVELWMDKDWLGRNEYKIVLPVSGEVVGVYDEGGNPVVTAPENSETNSSEVKAPNIASRVGGF